MSGHLSWYAAEVRPVGANISKYLGTILANELFELDYCQKCCDVVVPVVVDFVVRCENQQWCWLVWL